MRLLLFIALGWGLGAWAWQRMPGRLDLGKRARSATHLLGIAGAVCGGAFGSAAWGEGVLFAARPAVVFSAFVASAGWLWLLAYQCARLMPPQAEKLTDRD